MRARPLVSSIYTGTVVHVRRAPVQHSFRSRVAFYLIDLDELPRLRRGLGALFTADHRPGLLALRAGDHLPTDAVRLPDRPSTEQVAANLRERVTACLARHDIGAPHRVLLATNLRLAGYVFNPVSVWYCYDEHDAPMAAVVDVSNTWGEHHPYVLTAEEQPAAERRTWRATRDKALHVSPFLSLDYRYELSVRFPVPSPAPGAGHRAGDDYDFRVHAAPIEGDGPPFTAVQRGRRAPLTRRAVLRAQVLYPAMPQSVMGRIHWQALKLWRRGVRFRTRPPYELQRGTVGAPGAQANVREGALHD